MWRRLHSRSYAGNGGLMAVEMVKFRELKRAEGKLVAPAPALSEAQNVPGVQHLMNLTIPTSQVKFDMPVRS